MLSEKRLTLRSVVFKVGRPLISSLGKLWNPLRVVDLLVCVRSLIGSHRCLFVVHSVLSASGTLNIGLANYIKSDKEPVDFIRPSGDPSNEEEPGTAVQP